jgi:hypothetical protein
MNMLDRDTNEDDVSSEEQERVSVLAPYFDLKRTYAQPGSAIRTVFDSAREQAIAANAALIKCDPTKAAIIRELQWRVRRFWALVSYFDEILENGAAAVEDLSVEEQAEMQKLLGEADQQQKDY